MRVSSLCFAIFLTCVSALRAQRDLDTLWTRSWGGPDEQGVVNLFRLSGNEFLLAGIESGNLPHLMRLTATGDTLWNRRIDGTHGSVYVDRACRSSDGGLFFSGFYGSYPERLWAYVAKADSEGRTLWTQHHLQMDSLHDWSQCHAVVGTSDGGCISTSYSYSYQHSEFPPSNFLVRLNANGDTVWTRSVALTTAGSLWHLSPTADGNFVGANYVSDYDSIPRLYKFSPQGDSLWVRSLPRFGLFGLRSTTDGGFIAFGSSVPLGPNSDTTAAIAMRLDAEGNSIWIARARDCYSQCFTDAIEAPDHSFIVTGFSNSWSYIRDAYVARISATGIVEWAWPIDRRIMLVAIVPAGDDGYLIAGIAEAQDDIPDYGLIRLGTRLTTAPSFILHPSSFILSASPNPFNPTTQIDFSVPIAGRVTIRVFNLLGQQVSTLQDGILTVGEHRVLFDGGQLPAGIYFLRIEAATHQRTLKLVLLK